MSRYIDADALTEMMRHMFLNSAPQVFEENVYDIISYAPSIDIDDYVPKDFHDKTCEAMAKARREEIADMVRVVRCKECNHWWNKYGDSACLLHSDFTVSPDDYCSYGEREGE